MLAVEFYNKEMSSEGKRQGEIYLSSNCGGSRERANVAKQSSHLESAHSRCYVIAFAHPENGSCPDCGRKHVAAAVTHYCRTTKLSFTGHLPKVYTDAKNAYDPTVIADGTSS